MKIFYCYLIAVNLFTFFLYGIDKSKARKNQWRISEFQLIFWAIVGGSIGAWAGMQFWHHKTKHVKFRIGIPVIILIQLLLLFFASHSV